MNIIRQGKSKNHE